MHFNDENIYDDDMGVLKYLIHTVPGLLPVSGSFAELDIAEPDFDSLLY